MPFPSFSKPGLSTVNFSRAPIAPEPVLYAPRQLRQEAENGTIFVYTLSDARRLHTLIWQEMSAADWSNLLTFLQGIPWGADSFTYTDVDSTAHTVWYDGTPLRFQRTAAGTYSGQLVLLEDMN